MPNSINIIAMQSAQRVSQRDASDNFVFQRSQLAYFRAAELVSGDVLEIGTGSGYGISIIAPRVRSFTTVDKYLPPAEHFTHDNVQYLMMNVPPLSGIETGSMDFVISFQVIEHIKDDFEFVKEVHRVLKKGGQFIVSTPNRVMSLTRNPWHIREYTSDEFQNLMGCYFENVDVQGVFGREKVMEYYAKNRESVRSITKYDILDLQHRLPLWLLRLPYDVANRLNRRKLLTNNSDLTASITTEDYYFDTASDECFDLFCVAQKGL